MYPSGKFKTVSSQCIESPLTCAGKLSAKRGITSMLLVGSLGSNPSCKDVVSTGEGLQD